MIDNPLVVFRIPAPDDHSDDRILCLGDDETGRPLEMMTVPIENGERSTALARRFEDYEPDLYGRRDPEAGFTPAKMCSTRATSNSKSCYGEVCHSALSGMARSRGPNDSVWSPVYRTMPTTKSSPSLSER